jgi:hypothetical protein
MKLRPILLAYAAANAALYSAILPLWEGFDEPFHFGYVQRLADFRGLPDPRTSFLSGEIGASLLIAPASAVVRQNLPQVTTYSEFFALPGPARAARRTQLRELGGELRRQDSQFLNYEGHHPPLAYLALALPERILAGMPLPSRVLVLRVMAALAAALLLYFGAERLFAELGIAEPYGSAAIFCMFSCQMTWATVAHIANDWLAVPLAVWALAAGIRYWKGPNLGTAAALAGLLSLGLLTKAYFLALVPAALALCLLRKRGRDLVLAAAIMLAAAGPWYARNMLRYGSLTGMQESRAGIGVAAVLDAVPALDWPRVVAGSAKAALWTGNNSFLTFSGATLAALIALWLFALILGAKGRHGSAERIAALYCAIFLAALAYTTVVSFIYTRGAAAGPSPWYAQVLIAPLLGLAFLGCGRSPRPGRPVAAALMALFGYVLIATYAVKLIPLYGGYEGRATLASVAALYSKRLPSLVENLSLVALAPAGILLALTAVVAALTMVQLFVLIPGLFRGGQVLTDWHSDWAQDRAKR